MHRVEVINRNGNKIIYKKCHLIPCVDRLGNLYKYVIEHDDNMQEKGLYYSHEVRRISEVWEYDK